MSDVEWVPGVVGQVKAGDRVKLTKPDGNVLVREAQDHGSRVGLTVQQFNEDPARQYFIGWMVETGGWSLFVVEQKVELPIEPGLYRVGGRNALFSGTVQLTNEGGWWWIGNAWSPKLEKITAEYVAEVYMPLTLLEPAGVTAQKMRDRIFEEFENPVRSREGHVRFVAAEFGAES